jgi:hypothetical protein
VTELIDQVGPAPAALVETMNGYVATARGDAAAAYRAWMKVADESPLNEPQALMFAGRAAVQAKEVAAAQGTLDRLDRVGTHGALLDADRHAILAGIAALDGRRPEAVGEYRDALRRYRELGLDFDVAMTGMDFVTLLPDEPEARETADEARRLFERLGARPFLARLEAASSAEPSGSRRRSQSDERAAAEAASERASA